MEIKGLSAIGASRLSPLAASGIDDQQIGAIRFKRHPAALDWHSGDCTGDAAECHQPATWFPFVWPSESPEAEEEPQPASRLPDIVEPLAPSLPAETPLIEGVPAPPEPVLPLPVEPVTAPPTAHRTAASEPELAFAELGTRPDAAAGITEAIPVADPDIVPGQIPRAASRQWLAPALPALRRADLLTRPSFNGLRFSRLLVVAGVVVACGLGFAVAGLLGKSTVTATFNAPMQVIRAAGAARVVTVAVQQGQVVDAQSPLLTLQAANSSNLQVVHANLHGVVRSVETTAGADVAAGTPLIRLQDCDHAFLTVSPEAALTAGETVQIRMFNEPEFRGTVRPASGIMEPPNALVIGVQPSSLPSACPVGRLATVSPTS